MRAADIAMYCAKSLGGGQHCLFDDRLAAEHQEKIETERALTEAVPAREFLLSSSRSSAWSPGKSPAPRRCCAGPPPRRTADAQQLHPDRRENRSHHRHRRLGRHESPRWSGRGTAKASPAAWRSMSVPGRWSAPTSFSRLRQASPTRAYPVADRARVSPRARRWRFPTGAAEIAALRADGATISIDDFGTGYSNIARLRTMPLDRVKLDPSLIADIEHCERARVIVQAVVQLIHGVGCEIVAEAVETVAQADILRTMGCQVVQGYVFAHPMYEDDFLDWIVNANRGSRSAA